MLPLLLLTACWMWKSPDELREQEVRMDMEDHYAQVSAARDAIIAGDAATAVDNLETLRARLPVPQLPEDLARAEKSLGKALAPARSGADLTATAAVVADASAACGDCHQAAGVQMLQDPAPPPATAMLRHQWAAERLWEGLVAPSEDALRAGWEALVETPMLPAELGEAASSPEVVALEARVHQLAGRVAAHGTPRAARAEAYGELMATCAACHAATGGGPAQP
ncbi:MAG: hypothetical protein H6739_26395 [Alphaproteobacteria bacterium]|nr:hypothetical protein [Alphaproteobacteria bacterium]